MGVFTVPIRVAKYPTSDTTPRVERDAIVDTGAMRLALPAEVIEELDLEHLDTIRMRLADGTRRAFRIFGVVELEVQGRRCILDAIEIPKGEQALLGSMPLQVLDWHVAPNEHRLLPNPLSPDAPMNRL